VTYHNILTWCVTAVKRFLTEAEAEKDRLKLLEFSNG